MVNILITYFWLAIILILQFCLVCLEFNRLPFFTASITVFPRARQHSHRGPELCCKAHFGSKEISPVTNGV